VQKVVECPDSGEAKKDSELSYTLPDKCVSGSKNGRFDSSRSSFRFEAGTVIGMWSGYPLDVSGMVEPSVSTVVADGDCGEQFVLKEASVL
jgi:hypothetical protein